MWSEIVGHEQPIAQLRAALAHDQVAAAYLFAGPIGVGKWHVARTLAQALLCGTGPERPCGTCSACQRVRAGTHPDLVSAAPLPDKATHEILVDQIRHMKARLQLHALEGNRKVAIVDEADCLKDQAANAALKLLEEPPARTHLILIAAQPERLLPTIRSRCQTIRFLPLPTRLLTQYLRSQGLDEAEARQRALFAEGSVGRALQFPTEIFAETLQDLHTVLTETATARWLDVAERWSADLDTLLWRLQVAGVAWRDALATRVSSGRAEIRLPATDSLRTLLTQRTARRLSQELQLLFLTTTTCTQTTINRQLCCETLFAQLAA
ncbi:MAG: DNA polymerase III subunit delta' [Deltaproteobacteria bacterium]|nr:DNA polymerase III subunit delta' [Deltaproteobacteria bacterium]